MLARLSLSPRGSRWHRPATAAVALAVAVAAATPAAAAILSGRVVDPLGVGVGDVDVDVRDPVTGVKLPTENDSTDADGTFDILVPNGVFDVSFNAPQETLLVSIEIEGVVVQVQRDLGDVQLEAGALLSGRIVDAATGLGVFDADTDVDDPFTGERIVTPLDDTDVDGFFSAVVPFGTIDLTVEPAQIDRLAAARLLALEVTGDFDVGTISLDAGFLVSGLVEGPSGPADGVEFDVYAPDGTQVPAPSSTSDVFGAYSFVIAAGTYTLLAEPPIRSGLGHVEIPDVVVDADLVQDVALATTAAGVAVAELPRLGVPGTSFTTDTSLRNNTATSQSYRITFNVELVATGQTVSPRIPINVTLPAGSLVTAGLGFPVPATPPPSFVGTPLHYVVTVFDQVTQEELDRVIHAFELVE